MATVDGDLRIGIVTHIDGLLCLINRCRGLDNTGKAQWHTIGDAAVDAAVVIGVSGGISVFGAIKRIIGFRAAHIGQSTVHQPLQAYR